MVKKIFTALIAAMLCFAAISCSNEVSIDQSLAVSEDSASTQNPNTDTDFASFEQWTKELEILAEKLPDVESTKSTEEKAAEGIFTKLGKKIVKGGVTWIGKKAGEALYDCIKDAYFTPGQSFTDVQTQYMNQFDAIERQLDYLAEDISTLPDYGLYKETREKILDIKGKAHTVFVAMTSKGSVENAKAYLDAADSDVVFVIPDMQVFLNQVVAILQRYVNKDNVFSKTKNMFEAIDKVVNCNVAWEAQGYNLRNVIRATDLLTIMEACSILSIKYKDNQYGMLDNLAVYLKEYLDLGFDSDVVKSSNPVCLLGPVPIEFKRYSALADYKMDEQFYMAWGSWVSGRNKFSYTDDEYDTIKDNLKKADNPYSSSFCFDTENGRNLLYHFVKNPNYTKNPEFDVMYIDNPCTYLSKEEIKAITKYYSSKYLATKNPESWMRYPLLYALYDGGVISYSIAYNFANDIGYVTTVIPYEDGSVHFDGSVLKKKDKVYFDVYNVKDNKFMEYTNSFDTALQIEGTFNITSGDNGYYINYFKLLDDGLTTHSRMINLELTRRESK